MKRIIFLMLAILVWSCSKDDTNSISESQVQTRQSADYQIDNFDPPRNYEDLRDCYNQFVRDGVETFNEKFGEDVGKRITYVTEGDISQVIPLFKGEELENILWINEEYYFLLNKSEEHDSLGKPLRSYSRIFELSRTDFLSGNSSSLSQFYVTQNSEHELRLIENLKTVTPDEVYGKPYNLCSHWEDEWLLIYYDFLGLIPPLGGDLPPDVIEFETMNEIINSVTGGACVCPLPCLVIQALNEHTDVMQSAKELANQNYVMYEFGLDNNYPIETISSSILFELVKYGCSYLPDWSSCTTSPLPNEVINNAFTIPFDNENFISDFNNSLNNLIEDAYLGNCGDWEEPCWEEVLGEHWDDAVDFSDWCSHYSGFNFGDFNDGGWFVDFDSPIFEDDDYRYVIDPTNSNYVIDMRHFLFVGFFFEVTTGSGNAIGDFIEFGQLFFSHAQNSALNWQDFFSNRMGSAFARYLMESNIDWEDENTNLADLICDFLDSPLSLYLRPFPNPEDC